MSVPGVSRNWGRSGDESKRRRRGGDRPFFRTHLQFHSFPSRSFGNERLVRTLNWPFPNFFKPLPQNESGCSSFHMKMRFHSLAN